MQRQVGIIISKNKTKQNKILIKLTRNVKQSRDRDKCISLFNIPKVKYFLVSMKKKNPNSRKLKTHKDEKLCTLSCHFRRMVRPKLLIQDKSPNNATQ